MFRSFFNYPDQTPDDAIAELTFLPQWEDNHWQLFLKYGQLRHFQPGDYIARHGDKDRSFYIIIDGTLDVLIPKGNSGQKQVVRSRHAGTVVGELAFLDGRPRSADLRAQTEGQLFGISTEAFEVFAAHEPELAREVLIDLARILAIKLRQANNFISHLIR